MSKRIKLLLAGSILILLASSLRAQSYAPAQPSTTTLTVLAPPTTSTMELDEGGYVKAAYHGVPQAPAAISYPTRSYAVGTVAISPPDAISGSITPGTMYAVAASVDYRREIYVNALSGANIGVRFTTDITASPGTGSVRAEVDFGTVTYSLPDGGGTLSEAGRQWDIPIRPSASNWRDAGGERYYGLGQLRIYAAAGSSAGPASFNAGASNITAHYIGKVLLYKDGSGQTWSVNKELPKPLKVQVVDGETGAPYGNAPITFWLVDPSQAGQFENGGVSITTHTYSDGTAWVPFTFGPSTGTYTINASCPANVCTSGADQVSFAETAKGTKLTCVNCTWTGPVSQQLANPFRLRVIDEVTGAPVAGAAVTYSMLSYTDTTNHTSTNWDGANISNNLNPVSDIDGMSRAYMTLGADTGTYTARARCDSCVSGQEQILTGIAAGYDESQTAAAVPSGDPGGPCPSGCCPITPMLRVVATAPNQVDSRTFSFTTAANENQVSLAAFALPSCLGAGGTIKWGIEGANSGSGTPALNSNTGELNYFTVGSGEFPEPAGGRALPLDYNVTATMDYKDSSIAGGVEVKQDIIDKCRQEYIDLGAKLVDAPRSAFTMGIAGNFGKYWDCYANIYPTKEAGEAFSLEYAGYGFGITSGYRSPRYNVGHVGSSIHSTHMFGEAVDILPSGGPSNWKKVWDAATCPKILEYDKHNSLLHCGADTNGVVVRGGALPLGIPLDDIQVFSGRKNCIHLGERDHE